MLPDLLRIGRSKDHGRRPAVAELNRSGRVLPERTSADVDRLAYAAFATLVPCGDGVWNAGAGTGAGVDDVSAAASAHHVFLHRDSLADRHHPVGELYIPELPGADHGDLAARRPVPADLLAAIHEKELPRYEGGQTTCCPGS